MNKTKNILIILYIIIFSMTVFPYDWSNFRGINGQGISYETGINQNWSKKKFKVLWKISMGDDGYAGPCVADKTVYIIDRKGDYDIVKAIDLNNGKIKWEYKYKDGGNNNYGFARTTPLYENGKLYTLSKKGNLFCLNAANGKKIWDMNIVKKFKGNLPKWELSISPVIDGEKLIICPGGKTNVVTLNKNNGDIIWKGGNSDLIGYAAPVITVINSIKQYLIFTAYNIIGINSENGKMLWSYPWSTKHDVNAATPVVIDNKYVLITSNYGKGSMLLKISKDNKKAEPAWSEINKNIQAHFTTPVYYRDYIFANSDPGNLVCLDKKDGNVLWKKKGFGKGGLIAVDNIIIAMDGREGNIYFVEAKPEYKELAKIKPLGGQSWTAPVISEKKLIIRNRDAIACIDLN